MFKQWASSRIAMFTLIFGVSFVATVNTASADLRGVIVPKQAPTLNPNIVGNLRVSDTIVPGAVEEKTISIPVKILHSLPIKTKCAQQIKSYSAPYEPLPEGTFLCNLYMQHASIDPSSYFSKKENVRLEELNYMISEKGEKIKCNPVYGFISDLVGEQFDCTVVKIYEVRVDDDVYSQSLLK